MSSSNRSHDSSSADLRPLGGSPGGRVTSDRVIRPTQHGAMLEERFGLDDISALTEALVQKSRGRIEKLQGAAQEVEENLRQKVEETQAKIRLAMRAAQDQIEHQVRETARRSQEAVDQAYQEGRERGEAEGQERGYQSGFEKGYSEGLEKGLLEGRETALADHSAALEEKTAGLVPVLESLISAFQEESDGRRERAHRDLLELAFEIAKKVIRREAEAESHPAIVDVLRTAIDRLENRFALTIEIHPDDRRVVEEYVRTLNDQLDLAEGVSILENTDLAPGGCRVRNQFGSVDQTIETQLELIEERLFGEVGVRS